MTVALVLAAPSARAATSCVNPGGTGGCFASLDAAVAAAPRVATIEIAAGTYATAVDVPPGSRLTIHGAGVDATILEYAFGQHVLIARGPASRIVLSDLAFRDRSAISGTTGFAVEGGTRAVLQRTRFEGFDSAIAVFARGRVQLSGSQLSDGVDGLVCFQGGIVEVDDTTIVDAFRGIRADRCRTRVTDTRISRSGYVGIASSGGSLVVEGSAIVRGGHAGIEARLDARVRVVESTIRGNGFSVDDESRSGIDASGIRSLEVVRSTVTRNAGAGVRALAAPLEMLASTVSGNAGHGILTWIGLDGRPPLRLTSSTIADNGETGVACIAPSCGPVTASILARNGQDCSGDLLSGGFNIVQTPDGCGLIASGDADLVGVDPLLGPLTEEGGPTPTHPLLAGSPAIGAVTRGGICGKPDQRGVQRRRPCDAGAYEAAD